MDSFFETPAGKLTQYWRRRRRRLRIVVGDLEPQSKRMADAEKDELQHQVFGQLKEVRRAAFRGPLALSVRLSTTKATAPQAHTIAKNLLDLLGPRRPTVRNARKHLLYKDDSQIHALSVSCLHGNKRPMIEIEASSFAAILNDLELAAEACPNLAESNHDNWDEPIASFRELIQDEARHRSGVGERLYENMVKIERWSAQRALLTRGIITTAGLSLLFDRPKNEFMRPVADMWKGVIRETPIRVHVGELPATPGSSAVFKQRIESALADFKREWNWLISPLVVPVGLEVVVRPSPATPNAVLHDLDNVMRDYLLPQVVPKFGTVTNHRWTNDLVQLRLADPDLAANRAAAPNPPKATRDGVARYEVWRLPAAPRGETGFVSVALVADTHIRGDFFQQIDEQIGRWADSLDSR
jgi:hypothetical protein